VVKEWRRDNPDADVPDGLILTQPWPAGPTDARADQVIYWALTPDLGHAESSILLGKRDDPLHGQEELHR
jgi:hypothetical protein